MKSTIIIVAISVLLLVSCSNNGKKAKTKEAKKVEKISNNKTQNFGTIKPSSTMDWRASHLGGLQPRFGKIVLKKAKFLVNNNKLTNASVLIDMSTLTVNSFPEGSEQTAKLTGHLKSADFFAVEKYPTSKFEITKVTPISGVYNSKITGNLTILETTKSITFNANVIVSDNEVALKSEDFSIDRTDWNLTYNVEGTAGVPKDYLIANNIGFTIDVAVTK